MIAVDAATAAQARDVLKRVRRVHIPNVLEERAAKALFEAMQAVDWRLVLNGEQGVYDFRPDDIAALDVGKRTQMLQVINTQAGAGFHFLYDAYRLSDAVEAGTASPPALADFYGALNSEPFLAAFRAITGDDRIAYVDAQATRYRPGHFLTEHTDDVGGKHRLYAYVLNLTPHWRTDWGGLLMFPSADGHVAEAYCPRWNALNILAVPQPHAVSVVAPFARGERLSITGWLRSQR